MSDFGITHFQDNRSYILNYAVCLFVLQVLNFYSALVEHKALTSVEFNLYFHFFLCLYKYSLFSKLLVLLPNNFLLRVEKAQQFTMHN